MIQLKSPSEIARLQESADLVSKVLNRIVEMAQPGVETREIDDAAERMIKRFGAIPAFKGYRGFPYTVCASVNEQVVHGFPSDRKLREGDVLSVDVGLIYNGYVGDCARSVGIGEVSEAADLLMRRAYYALREACRTAVAGKRIGDISHRVETIANEFGYGVVQDYVGHGVGKKMHEDPQVPNFGRAGTGPRIQRGLVIAIEPMFNIGTHEVETLSDEWTVVTKDRSLSVHVEDMVAITEDGPTILTSANGRIYPEEPAARATGSF